MHDFEDVEEAVKENFSSEKRIMEFICIVV
jgi:hypothetical protein